MAEGAAACCARACALLRGCVLCAVLRGGVRGGRALLRGARRRAMGQEGMGKKNTWSTDDEFRILEVLAAHRLEHGTLPQADVLANALAGKLDKSGRSPHWGRLRRRLRSRGRDLR